MTATTVTRASKNVRTRPMRLPAEDHPLYPLFAKHNLFRELAIEADRVCERLAPTPNTLADPDLVEKLAGADRDLYHSQKQARRTYENAAYQLNLAIMTVIDNLGGM